MDPVAHRLSPEYGTHVQAGRGIQSIQGVPLEQGRLSLFFASALQQTLLCVQFPHQAHGDLLENLWGVIGLLQGLDLPAQQTPDF